MTTPGGTCKSYHTTRHVPRYHGIYERKVNSRHYSLQLAVRASSTIGPKKASKTRLAFIQTSSSCKSMEAIQYIYVLYFIYVSKIVKNLISTYLLRPCCSACCHGCDAPGTS